MDNLDTSGTDTPGYELESISTAATSVQSELSELSHLAEVKFQHYTLELNRYPFEYHFDLEHHVYFQALRLRSRFLQSFDQATEPDEPSSVLELVLRFFNFIANDIPQTSSSCVINDHQKLLNALLEHIEQELLTDDIHVLAAESSNDSKIQAKLVGDYYRAYYAAHREVISRPSALLQSALRGDSKIFAVLGGQGITLQYFEELRLLSNTYRGFLSEYMTIICDFLENLPARSGLVETYPHGLNIRRWLESPHETPDIDYLNSAPVSFPLIGCLQLARYQVILNVLGLKPSEFRKYFAGIAGHSQGHVVAAVIGAAHSQSSFLDLSRAGVEILFWIGARSQQTYPEASIDPSLIEDAIKHGEGSPSPMLSVRNITEEQLQTHIDVVNTNLSGGERITISLRNGPRSFVLGGNPLSLHGFNVRLRQHKVAVDIDQTKTLFSKRKLTAINRFLPITAPFHTDNLLSAAEVLLSDLKHVSITRHSLNVPVYDPHSGKDIRKLGSVNSNIVPELIRSITVEPVNWEKATNFDKATHIIDLGPGSDTSIGMVTSHNKEGNGVRVILATALSGHSSIVGYKPEIFSRRMSSLVHERTWDKLFGPTLVRRANRINIVTHLSKLLNLPPILVAGMTPTTTSPELVAATTNAGYYVELAGGGYNSEVELSSAVEKIICSNPGRGININLVFASARSIAWQIPFVKKLHAQGKPIDGLTIGAGVPSLDVAQSYIDELGLKYIGFKPGSVRSIKAVIEIASKNKDFPIVLQWTGGRAGGHHSFEDFHAPIMEMYGQIRRCANISLVAGSGFTSSEDIYPYLTGTWSTKFGLPRMPFDGALLGSRLMTAKEARTSTEAKNAIFQTPGLPDDRWEETYNGPAGGIITVISEMGEPMHMLATRGALLWAEMDKIFKLGKPQQLMELRKKQKYIVEKLNSDFQKVWFGRNCHGQVIELTEMTYYEVLSRMIELMYVKSEARWINKSFSRLMRDFLQRVEERFLQSAKATSITDTSDNIDDPYATLNSIVENYPDTKFELITAIDVRYFLHLCQRPGQKPVPFIPIIDESFETYFKKDSLWQSEDLAAVVGRDVERTCILQGPTAAFNIKSVNEPVKDILGKIHQDLILALQRDLYENKVQNIPDSELVDETPLNGHLDPLLSCFVTKTPDAEVFEIPLDVTQLPTPESWYRALGGSLFTWRQALFLTEFIVSGQKRQANTLRRICAPFPGLRVRISNYGKPSETVVSIESLHENTANVSVRKSATNEELIVTWTHSVAPSRGHESLEIHLSYQPQTPYAPLVQILNNHIESVNDFYHRLWFPEHKFDFDAPISSNFQAGETKISAESILAFARATNNITDINIRTAPQQLRVPLHYGIVIAWKALTQPLFLKSIGASLLTLIHLSNSFKALPAISSLKVGDTVTTVSQILAVLIQDSGKVVRVRATIFKDKQATMEVVSEFMFRGVFDDYENTFEHKIHDPVKVHLELAKDVALLESKTWFSKSHKFSHVPFLGKTLTFSLESLTRFQSKNEVRSISVTGTVTESQGGQKVSNIGSISYTGGLLSKDLVGFYLRRHGSPINEPKSLPKPIPLHGKTPLPWKRSASSILYAEASGDFNPIHVSKSFAALANLPDTIIHGMQTCSSIGSLLEIWGGGNINYFQTSFVSMILPSDEIEIEMWHEAMISGRKCISIEAKKKSSGDVVLKGQAEIEQSISAYLFSGQGSQEQNMGMDLYDTSPVARSVWDSADNYFVENYGFKITDIVRKNPKKLTVHFGGTYGRRVRQNYINMSSKKVGDLSNSIHASEKMFPGIDKNTRSHTFHASKGLLFATQFTQPAIALMELAKYKDMQSKGLIPSDSSFAGHSLGEFPAIVAFAEIMSVEQLIAILFFRGMAMQVAVKRDEHGFSKYSMCAVNPSRIGSTLDQKKLSHIVKIISQKTEMVLEIVNYNITNRQYVCAGELRALECLAEVLEYVRSQHQKGSNTRAIDHDAALSNTIERYTEVARNKPIMIQLKRSVGVVPLEGIDVPFHSTFLQPDIPSFRNVLAAEIKKVNIDPERLVEKWIPNLTGKPFSIERDYIEGVFRLTKSTQLEELLRAWKPVLV